MVDDGISLNEFHSEIGRLWANYPNSILKSIVT